MSKYVAYDERIKELHSQGKRNHVISEKLDLDSRRVSDRLRVMGLKSNKRKFNDQPTEDEEKVFISMFIGDGAIYKSSGNINYRVNLAHSLSQRDYFMMKYNRVKEFCDAECFEETQYHKKAETHYHAIKFQSKVNPYFTRMRKKFYHKDKKIIPKDIKEYLDAELMAYKFFDDGSLDTSGYVIAMNDYDDDSIGYFVQAMKENFDIETNLHNQGKIIYIPKKERMKFKRLVEPYATKDVLYKLGEFRETPNEGSRGQS